MNFLKSVLASIVGFVIGLGLVMLLSFLIVSGIVGRLSKTYPDVLQELKSIVEERWSIESPAFHSRVRKLKLNLSIQ